MGKFSLDLPILIKYYFYPQKNEFNNPFWVNSENERLACYFHKKHPNAKTIIHFHGNGETVGDYIPNFVSIIDAMGFNCFFAEYRGYGMSTGTPSFLGMLKDVEAIINSINIPPEKLILYGRSFGTISALHGICIFPNISGLILESGIADLTEWGVFKDIKEFYPDIENNIRKYFNHELKLNNYKGETLIIHCLYDNLIPVTNSYRLYEWAREPKTMAIFEEGEHSTYITKNLTKYCAIIRNFIKSL
ncbi:MAG: alpha/beta hydrolase [ANME-2 cluster archaeon]|nr:MAG: alpha/beta hydrolase [ANME-2 cluster archaeon]